MKLLYVPLCEETLRRLEALARRERRVQDQAAYLLEKALEKEAPEGQQEEG